MPCHAAPPANTRGNIAGIRLHSAQPTLCFQAWLCTNGAALVLRTGIMVCRSAGFELVQGDERIVAIFRYTGLPALMVPDPHQYDLVRDKFVGIEQKNLSAIYRTRQRALVFVLQAQQQMRRRFPLIDGFIRGLLRIFPGLASKRS